MRIALTGGASGIGAALVERLKGDGHSVTSFDIAEPAGVDTWIETDLSDPAAIDRAVAAAPGTFDALVKINCSASKKSPSSGWWFLAPFL